MPRARLPTKGGMFTNIRAAGLPADGRGPVVMNLVCDAAGNSRSRPGYARWPTATTQAVTLVYGLDTGAGYTPLTGGTAGLYGFGGYLLHVSADRMLRVYNEDGTGRNASTMGGGVRLPGVEPVVFTEDDDGSVILCGGGAPCRWVPGDGTALELLCPTASPVASHAASMTRRLFVNNAAEDTVYYTSPTNHRVFDLTGNPNLIEAGWFRAESRRDPVLAMVAGWNLLYLVGPKSTDVYMPVNDIAGPVSLAWSSPMGTAARRSVVFSDDVVYLLGTDRRFYRLGEGRQFSQISYEIENRLRELDVVEDCIAQEIDIGGSILVAWTFPTDAVTFVYDVTTSAALGQATWYEWRGWNGSRWTAMPLAFHAYVPEWNEHFISGTESTQLYRLSMDLHTDDGATRRCIRQTPPWDHGSRLRKFGEAEVFHGSWGTTAVLDEDEDHYEPKLIVRHRDEGQRWGNDRELSSGRMGERYYSRHLRRNGAYRVRELQVEHTAPCDFYLGDVEEVFDVGME